jgi:rhodanese-related sulfurtransferase
MKYLISLFVCLLLVLPAYAGDSADITATELMAQILVGKAPVIVDVRSRREYEAGHIPGAIHVSFWSTYWNADRIPVSGHDPVVVYCAHGPRAGIAGWGLDLAGIPNVVMLKGHMKEWAKLALPVVTGEYPE